MRSGTVAIFLTTPRWPTSLQGGHNCGCTARQYGRASRRWGVLLLTWEHRLQKPYTTDNTEQRSAFCFRRCSQTQRIDMKKSVSDKDTAYTKKRGAALVGIVIQTIVLMLWTVCSIPIVVVFSWLLIGFFSNLGHWSVSRALLAVFFLYTAGFGVLAVCFKLRSSLWSLDWEISALQFPCSACAAGKCRASHFTHCQASFFAPCYYICDCGFRHRLRGRCFFVIGHDNIVRVYMRRRWMSSRWQPLKYKDGRARFTAPQLHANGAVG
jgi:hypothetical protein